jgi:hypothetical protein
MLAADMSPESTSSSPEQFWLHARRDWRSLESGTDTRDFGQMGSRSKSAPHGTLYQMLTSRFDLDHTIHSVQSWPACFADSNDHLIRLLKRRDTTPMSKQRQRRSKPIFSSETEQFCSSAQANYRVPQVPITALVRTLTASNDF